jgi:hypothetical protein
VFDSASTVLIASLIVISADAGMTTDIDKAEITHELKSDRHQRQNDR